MKKLCVIVLILAFIIPCVAGATDLDARKQEAISMILDARKQEAISMINGIDQQIVKREKELIELRRMRNCEEGKLILISELEKKKANVDGQYTTN